MIALDFMADSDLEGAAYTEAAQEYQSLWTAEGSRIVSALEGTTALRFQESYVHAVVYSGISQSHPLCLRAEYPPEVKLGTLIHELGHRLVYGARHPAVRVSSDDRPSSEDVHKVLNLFLFDVWTDLYGEDFAQAQVAVERARTTMYASAWDWALDFDRATRAELFRRTLVDD